MYIWFSTGYYTYVFLVLSSVISMEHLNHRNPQTSQIKDFQFVFYYFGKPVIKHLSAQDWFIEGHLWRLAMISSFVSQDYTFLNKIKKDLWVSEIYITHLNKILSFWYLIHLLTEVYIGILLTIKCGIQ